MADFTVIELLLLQLFLIFLNAVFACAEIAVISVNENKLKKLSEEGNRKAKRLLSLTVQPAKFLATIQVGITLAGFLGSAFAADQFFGSHRRLAGCFRRDDFSGQARRDGGYRNYAGFILRDADFR